MTAHLRLEEVCKSYPGAEADAVLRGVSLELERGGRLLITGSSGTGKSTLLNLLGGLDRPDSGRIWAAGREIGAMGEGSRARWRGRSVAMVFQGNFLPRGLRAWEAVACQVIWGEGATVAEARGRAREALAAVELEEKAEARVESLSGGQRQRVALARALASRAELVLADEPTTQLDPELGKAVAELLTRLSVEEGRTVVLISHEHGQSWWAGWRRAGLREGLLEEGSAG
ncbi:MAG: ATP-binding cassette domain-containing protein [Sumerlaeia bacterium]